MVSGEEITNPCNDCNGKGKNKLQKKYQLQFQKVLMMEQELD
jgi:DnaJ-class molecular chaperone